MKTVKFKCTLLSDVILNVKSASQGNNRTLDFIPGNNFLGIVAKKYREFGDRAMTVFHSGKVRFGDAHLGADGIRSHKIPASMFYPKLGTPEKGCYIHHALPSEGSPVQLKQCGQGFYIFKDTEATRIQETRRFAIKSAYDRDKRRSADEMMFGYESLVKGAVLYFDVEIDDDTLAGAIIDALCGKHHIGRSRTAQYGLVEIDTADFKEVPSSPADGMIAVYADSRLIFLDENGHPTLQPTPGQLGINGGRIAWDKSQVRTFRYAPWNFMRQSFDTDRCGIEKGSVIVVEGGSVMESASRYVGSYRNEGFGKIVYNPSFLDADNDGKAKCCVADRHITTPKVEVKSELGNDMLLKHLLRLRDEEAIIAESYKIVNDFVKENKNRFKSADFASQWGSIRSIVMRCSGKKEIVYKLFDEKKGYIAHGVAKEKWEEKGRRKKLEEFVKILTDANAVLVMVNLCSEMAKICRKEDRTK